MMDDKMFDEIVASIKEAGDIRAILAENKMLRNSLLWLKNNMHSYGSDIFRGYLEAMIENTFKEGE